MVIRYRKNIDEWYNTFPRKTKIYRIKTISQAKINHWIPTIPNINFKKIFITHGKIIKNKNFLSGNQDFWQIFLKFLNYANI